MLIEITPFDSPNWEQAQNPSPSCSSVSFQAARGATGARVHWRATEPVAGSGPRDRRRSGSNQLCLAERERLRNVGVDTTAGERLILLVKVNRGVDLEDNISAPGVWQEIDPDEIRANGASGIDRD